ncbi:uncharacterized protein LOC125205065 [Salvia hispanica]|uniref:uncharacterized protein LOC125205065 n=1 Tax=Salvia hispanica TaxID=49212 RepID=UPI002009CE74|nr:uncharacterized protein LOC125205065 [Salvia hispanica]
MSPDRPNLWRILSDTSSLINAHSLHFTALLILFLFPSSFATVVYFLLSLPNNPLQTLQPIFSAADYQIPAVGASHLLVSLISLIFTICATASISSSTFNAFYGQPVELATALKSALVKFLPLLATTLVVQIVIGVIVFVFIGFLAITSNGIADSYNQYYLAICIAVALLFVALLIYLQIEWSLSNAVVVLESDWGFAALKRSSYLVKGAWGVMFSFMLFFMILAGVFVICFFKYVMIEYGSGGDGWNCWLVWKIAAFAAFSSVLSLYSVAALTVFFIYCKASRHELHFEIDAPNGKLGDDYAPLPYDVIV